MARDIRYEIAGLSPPRHLLDALSCAEPYPLLHVFETGLPEPSGRDPPISEVMRSIHVDQRPDQMRAAAHERSRFYIRSSRQEGCGSVSVPENLAFPANVDNIGILCEDPKRIEFRQRHACDRVAGSQQPERAQQLFSSGVSPRGNNDLRQVRGHGTAFHHDPCLWSRGLACSGTVTWTEDEENAA